MIVLEQIKIINSGDTNMMAIVLPSAITIIGFIVNYFISRRNYRNDINKIRKNLMIEKSEELIKMFTEMFSPEKIKEKDKDFFVDIMNKLYIYGSKEVIEMFADYQQYNYATDPEDKKAEKLFAYFCLIISLIKYDLTGEIINPKAILKIKINDYSTSDKMKMVNKEINELVEKYNLNKEFKIQED